MQAARCVNKPLPKTTIKSVTAPSRRASVRKRTARNNSHPGRSGIGSAEDHTGTDEFTNVFFALRHCERSKCHVAAEDSFQVTDTARSSSADDKELRNGIDISVTKDLDTTIGVATTVVSIVSLIPSLLQTAEMHKQTIESEKQTFQSEKQTIQSEKQTQIMQQDSDAVDLAGVAAIAKAVKNKQMEGSSAAHFLIQHGGLTRNEVVGLNDQIAKHVPGDDIVVEVIQRTTTPTHTNPHINPGVKSMATMSGGRENWPKLQTSTPPQTSTHYAGRPFWDLPFTLYTIYTLAMLIIVPWFFLGRIWRRYKAEQNVKNMMQKKN